MHFLCLQINMKTKTFGYTVSFIYSSLGADFKNDQTTKQLNNSIWTNSEQVKYCFYLPIGPKKLFNCLVC